MFKYVLTIPPQTALQSNTSTVLGDWTFWAVAVPLTAFTVGAAHILERWNNNNRMLLQETPSRSIA